MHFPQGHRIRSLVWSEDVLVDVVGGEASVDLNGQTTPRSIGWAFSFDRAILAPSGLRVLYSVVGTKALVATPRSQVRELNRSYYHAEAYEYPIAVTTLPDGREVLAHCPDGYNRLAIETLADGVRLSAATEKASDVFHSRLRFSPDGRYLLSAGWVWHPLEVIAVFNVEQALNDGEHLDAGGLLSWRDIAGEVEAACWLDSETLVVTTNPEEEAIDDESHGLPPGHMGVWSVRDSAWLAQNPISGHSGTLHALPSYGVLCLFGHPRLLDPMTGAVLDEWPALSSGEQKGSITWGSAKDIPPFALDADHGRFALAAGETVSVVDLDR